MKKYLVLLFVPLIFACGQSAEEKRLAALNDSLNNELANHNKSINDFMSAFNEIEDNLATIKQKEGMIKMTTDSGELSQSAKDRINQDILDMYQLMQQNKQKVAALTKQLGGANLKVAEFEKMVKSLNDQLQQKDQEMAVMKDQLAKMDFDIKKLNDQISQLNTNISDVTTESAQKSDVINKQTADLNRVFYAFGTRKELISNGVLSKTGVFGTGEKIADDVNKKYFTEIDLTKVKSIKLLAKKAEVMTQHPAASYQIAGGKDRADSLVIKNTQDFWSMSKYLVVVIEN